MTREAADGALAAQPAMAASDVAARRPSALDRVLTIGTVNLWIVLIAFAFAATALVLRLARLGAWALDTAEAARAYDAWTIFRGQPPVSGVSVTDTGALLLLLEVIAFFLFGATDVVVRLVPVAVGLALVALPVALRRWVGTPAALAMSGLAAVSPTLVYASRVVSPEIVIATLALAAIVLIVELAGSRPDASSRAAAALVGVAAGAAFAAGPSAISVAVTLVIAIAITVFASPSGAIRRGLARLRGELLTTILAAVATSLVLFSRFFSHPAGLAGARETIADWWRLLVESSGQPASLFIMLLLVYELIAVAFSIVAIVRRQDATSEAVIFFAAWGISAFTIWSFSAGRHPAHTVHVVLPVVLLGGIGLGATLSAIDWTAVRHGTNGMLALLFLGLVTGLGAFGILLRRASASSGNIEAMLPAVAVLCLVVVPLAYLIWRLSLDEREAGKGDQPALIALFVLAILLGAFALRSATLLSFYRADLGVEPLAQRTATLGTLPAIDRFLRLARDVGVGEGSARDPTGSHSLAIAIEQDVLWPYVWYFREFPDLTVHEPGAASTAGAQVVIAAADAGFADNGYATQRWPWLNTVPAAYLSPDAGAALRALVNPGRWVDVWRFLLFRDGVPLPEPATVAVGLTPELAGRVMVATGPFDLADRPGPGTEPGQFKDPIGVAVSADGEILVVDSGNARVQRFSGDGDFIGIWGEGDGNITFTRTANGLGPTGLTLAPDGQTWVADTWGHRVVALDEHGDVVRSIGGETIDIADDPARVDEAGGLFFGPRDVAIASDAIYVVDTGNERVQRFTPDGEFVDAWGGYGRGPDQLIEPVGIAIGPDGNIYVADSGNARISIFTANGELVANWPVSDWPTPDPGGLPPAFQPYLAFDAEGNLYATASNAGQAVVLDRQGSVFSRVTQAGNERMAQPIGVAVASDGAVLFSDIGRDAVLEYTPPPRLTGEDLDAADLGASPEP